MGRKIVTSIRIDEEVFLKAKKMGLNISNIAEKGLRDLITLMEGKK